MTRPRYDTAQATAGPESADRRSSVVALVVALLAACTAFQLNASMLSPVLVVMGRELHADQITVGLSQTAFYTGTAVFGLFLPRLSDIAGRRRVLLGMMTVMIAGEVLAALAPDMTVLIVARGIQGVTGAVVPICLMILRDEVRDPRRYGTLMGVVTAINGGIAGLDAILGGMLGSTFGFRSVFWLIAVVGVVAVVFCYRGVPESRPSRGVRLDWYGVLFLAGVVLLFQSAVNEMGKGRGADWTLIGALLAGGAVCGAVFWRIEGTVAQPLASPALLKRRATWATVGTTVLTLAGVIAAVNGIAMSIAQDSAAGFDLGADSASLLLLTPYALLGWIVAPFAGRLAPATGYRAILRIGLAGSVAGLVGLAVFGTRSLVFLVGATLLLGVVYAGMANIMLNGLGVVLSPPGNPGFLPGLNSAGFGLGAGLSFAILPAVQVAADVHGQGSRAGYTWALLVGAAIMALALLMSLLIPQPVEAETAD
ncbi:MFS transporter [Streptomyces sp. SID10853]|uniref:MFS transporter n=1 Tax=Streptomyces sp. SID10853 TaxID=2706028 RepID=UPI0013BFF10B|nr:MFS transporter [Streptomyces sp. SID10853]NDZ79523.1 MFS transporter [Streptomyces sp. SID10853]